MALPGTPHVRSVVIVDEDDRIAESVAEALRSAGIAARAARSVHRAVLDPASPAPEAWIVGSEVPGLRGEELVRLLRASPREELRSARVVGLSPDRLAREPFLSAGADAFVESPATAADLLDALDGGGAASLRASDMWL